MRLADQLIAAAQDRRIPIQADYQRVGAAVRAAIRYEVDAAGGAMAGAIGKSDARRLREARRFARTPFTSFWIEWLGSSGEFYGNGPEPLINGQVRPFRTGMLVETDDSHQRGTMTMCWSGMTPDGKMHVEVSPICATFDWREEAEAVPTVVRRDDRPLFPNGPQGRREEHIFRQIASLTPEEFRDDEARHGYIANPRLSVFHAIMGDEMQRDAVGTSARLGTVMNDWHGEINFIYSLLICLNSRNLLRVEPGEDLARLNKARRRLGRPEILTFSTVSLSLSQVMRRKTVAAAGGGGDVRAHLVSGHFKLRKTGAFWWSPFVRGDTKKGVVVRRGYEVTA